MEEQLANQIIQKLEPSFYGIGMLLVFVIVTFGGTLITLWSKSRDKQSDKLEEILRDLKQLGAQHTLEIGKLETKLELYIEKHEKDLNNLGNKLRQYDT